MRAVTDTFLRTLRGSHEMCARARVVLGNPEGTDPDGTELAILAGSVKLDANADIRGSLSLTVPGLDAWPTSSSGLLTPYGAEVFVERGLVLGNGVREWVSQGYYRIDDMSQEQVPDGNITITGLDRMAGIRDARLVAPIYFGAGSSLELVFETLVLEIYPGATIVFDFDAVGTEFDTPHVCEEDRYGFLLEVVRAHGKVMFWDHLGRLRVESPPDPASPVWEINSGAGGVLITMTRKLGRQGVYNGVVVLGEAPGEGDPVRSVARDLNPASPTYWEGSFGKVPRFFSSSFITTQDQADSAGVAMLARALGLPYNVGLANVPNAALEPLDPVLVTHPQGSELHVLETVAMSLTHRDAMACTTREQTTVLIAVGA